jgi:tetratricopeptide (TPR) repeat protein
MTRRADASRDLLLGLLALQNALVTRDQLVLAFASWTAMPGKPLAVVLAEQSALRPEHVTLLDALVDAHLKLHGGDAERSIASLDQTLEATGDLEGALARYRQALAIFSHGAGGRVDRERFENALHTSLARIELTRGRDNAAVISLIPTLERHAKTTPLPVAAERYAAALTDALADRGDSMTAIALLSALRNDSSYIHSRSRLDWMRPLFQSLIGGNQLRLGDRQQAIPMLRESVERMERSHIKVPRAVLAAARARLAQVDAPSDSKGQPVPSER